MKPQYDYLIVGAGLFGAVFAHEAQKRGLKCRVVERRDHIGGNIYCETIEGIDVHKYGAHIFHTDNKVVWDYVNQFVRFNGFINTPIANYRGELYNLPFNMNTFRALWGVSTPEEARAKIEEQSGEFSHITEPANLEEQALALCGRDIYEKLIKGYTEKQWGRRAVDLPAFIIKRIPLRFSYNNNYYDDAYQGVPIGGYNKLIEALLEGVEVDLATDYLAHRNELRPLAQKVLFTGCIDQYFDYCYGRLKYRSLRFETMRLDCPDFQGNAVVNYTDYDVPYTRIIEHKHFESGNQPSTIITREYPDNYAPGKEPYYPINDACNMALYERYRALAAEDDTVIFGGRLGMYIYADMDDTIEAALTLCRQEFKL